MVAPISIRKLQALWNLAERPGTLAEGEVAKRMLAKFGHPYCPGKRADGSPDPKAAPCPKKTQANPIRPFNDKLKLAEEVHRRFPVGSEVFFTAFGFGQNSRGQVIAFERAGVRLRVWFDGAPTPDWIHAISDYGWHLTRKKMSKKDAARMCKHRATG